MINADEPNRKGWETAQALRVGYTLDRVIHARGLLRLNGARRACAVPMQGCQ